MLGLILGKKRKRRRCIIVYCLLMNETDTKQDKTGLHACVKLVVVFL